MLRVPRHEFVPSAYRDQAYEDHPIPIGEGQTISQPYIVALMLQALQISPEDKALEVGAGSGYATALLAQLAAEVYSIERHPALAAAARDILTRLGHSNIHVLAGDGTLGLIAAAPFSVILVSAASPAMPTALLQQLTEGGRMIIPIGTDDSQQLQFVRMTNGKPVISPRELVRFVPLISNRD
jgi:protein-L-isoaspartate(D-aspartate) O-methyltransferase